MGGISAGAIVDCQVASTTAAASASAAHEPLPSNVRSAINWPPASSRVRCKPSPSASTRARSTGAGPGVPALRGNDGTRAATASGDGHDDVPTTVTGDGGGSAGGGGACAARSAATHTID